MTQNSSRGTFDNPLDTKVSAATRFAIELVAWIAGPCAAADIAGTWIAVIPTLVVLIALPGVFSTLGDKRHVVVAVPGPVRFLIELVLTVVAIYSALVVWAYIGALIVALIAVAAAISGAPRAKWLLSNKPPNWPLPSEQPK